MPRWIWWTAAALGAYVGFFWEDEKGDSTLSKVINKFSLSNTVLGRLRQFLPYFKASAAKHNVPLLDLIGIGWQESGFQPDAQGKPNANGSADYGIMQINNKAHPGFFSSRDWRNAQDSIDYAASILASNYKIFQGRGLTGQALRAAATAAYNTGAGNVKKSLAAGKSPDATTAGGKYGASVLARAASLPSDILSA